MSEEKEINPSSLVVKEDNASDEAKLPSKAEESPSQANKRNSNNVSSHQQLVNLAKRFCIEGAIIPVEQQAPIEDRARKRERIDHLRKQQNLEQIMQKSLAYCSEDQISERPDQDWFSQFISQAEDISNKTMQDLWARILAKEITQPGAFSLKALTTFRRLSVYDAKLLAKVVAFTVRDTNRKNMRILSGSMQQPGLFNFFSKSRMQRIDLNHHGLSYTDLLVLADNHLLFIQEAESTILSRGEVLNFNYNGQNLSLKSLKANCVLSFYKFTPIGAEIMSLIGDRPDNSVLATIKQGLSEHFSAE